MVRPAQHIYQQTNLPVILRLLHVAAGLWLSIGGAVHPVAPHIPVMPRQFMPQMNVKRYEHALTISCTVSVMFRATNWDGTCLVAKELSILSLSWNNT